MEKLRAIIIDDEASSRNSLRQKLATHCPEVEIIGECQNGEEGIQCIGETGPDIVFLDVEMPRMNGFTMLQQLAKRDFEVIFTTAYDHYAVQAIRFSALDYLVKPVELPGLKEAVNAARQKRTQDTNNERLDTLLHNLVNEKNLNNRLVIPTYESLLFVELSNIIFLQAESNYTIIYLQNAPRIVVSKTLKDFEELLPHTFFIRIHHSYIINKKRVVKYLKGEGGQVIMSDGQRLDVARRKRDEFLRAMSP